ncbi:MAG: hypothetical protein ACNI28_10300 [Arcobacter sp.]|uniref:hypothetical protein n=1 Tax=Arcobacter sp. TaxID=1872629 RepID=UPI003B00E976
MTIKEEYKILLIRETELKTEIENLKIFIKNNHRDFENLNFVELDFDRKMKCRKNLKGLIK